MNSNETNKLQVVKHLVESYLQGDVAPIFAALADDVTVRLTIAEGTPLSGVFKGPAGVGEYFTRNAEAVAVDQMEILNYLVGGDQVAVTGRETLVVRKSGQSVKNSDWIMLYTFRNDQISEILIVEDTSAIAAAYREAAPPDA